jgi:uncharacterized protein (TIGR02598 family)
MNSRFCFRPRRPGGFSLVEVTIAMGIVATVMIALLALLPYGMDNVREAKGTQVQARIANEIIGELQVADWGKEPNYAKLHEYDQKVLRYDGEGTMIEDTSEKNKGNTIYKARIEVPVTKEVLLPGQGGQKDQGRYLRRVTIKVAFAPNDKDIDFNTRKLPLPYKTYTSEIVKMARDRIK